MLLSFSSEENKMKHSVKCVFSVLLAIFILLLSTLSAMAFPEPTEDFYVADYAEVLSDATENMIISKNDLLFAQTGAQIVVVTVRYLEDGYYADEYAVKLFNDWGVGDSEKNNGILLLLVTEEGKGWLTQGSGIESRLSNDDVNTMLEKYFWKKFDKGDFDGAVETLFGELIEWYEDTYNFTLGDSSYVDTSSTSKSSASTSKMLFKIAIIIILIVIFTSSSGSSRRSYRRSFWIPAAHMWHHHSQHRSSNYRNNNFTSGSSFRGSSRSGGSFGGGFSGGSRGGGGGRSGGGGAGRR